MIDPQMHERASTLFLALRELPMEERRRRLRLETEGCEELHREVESLLEHDLPTVDRASGSAGAGSVGDDESRIGPYRIIRQLGRGGSGIVLLAEQDEPVRRRVAIKIVPHAAISPELAARFEFERRALERTEHPNIARILDTGRTRDGMPYLVMEFVEGEAITRYAREHCLDLTGRIALVLQVADAVEHAHQRGVIHRDLKPANILVSESSGKAVARVLDFGIAKPVAGFLDSDAHVTTGLALGTPAYMAPEQTGGQPVDTRADVYALGAVMYELAGGRPPVDLSGDAFEVMRRIRETEPPAASRNAAPGSAIARAPRSVAHDLDLVLAKALSRDPARRFPTVGAFADDLRRILALEPVSARAPTFRYRAARWVQRNRTLTAAAAVVTLAIALGLVGLGAGLVEARQQRREALNQSEAQREINRFLTDDLLAAASPEDQGDKITALELLRRASRRVDERFAGRPLIAGAIHHSLGSAYAALGSFDEADHHLARAVELRRAAAGPDALDTVHSEIAAASLLGQRQKYAEARGALVKVLTRARRILGRNDPALYAAINDLGVVDSEVGQGQDGVSLLTEALEGRERLLGPHDPQVLITTSNLAQAYDHIGDTKHSLELLLKALVIADAMPEPPRMVVLGLCNNIGATYQDLNRDAEAAPYLRRAATLASDWLGPENSDTLTIEANLAGLEAELGNPVRGAELYDIVAKGQAKALGPDAESTLTARYGRWNSLWHAGRFDEAAAGFVPLLADVERSLGSRHWLVAQVKSALGRALFDAGHTDEGKPYAEQAAAQFTALYGPDHARTKSANELVAQIHAKQNRGNGGAEAAVAAPPPR